MLDELLLWVGSHAKHPGHTLDVFYPQYRGVLGAIDETVFASLCDWAAATGWFFGRRIAQIGKVNGLQSCALTPKGWERYRELTRTRTASRFIFMAMKYNDTQLESVVTQHFAPAVEKTGFSLKRLDHDQPAGSIDDQLRMRIRIARMLICDLTHGNRGAYWEAGFAEGLGKPVIYTCRQDVFSNPADPNHPHFDTSHLVTVVWDPGSPQTAAEKLKSHIRATLPAEARLED